MLCPICQNETKVLESRSLSTNTAIRRRRECLNCKFRFSTVEEVEILDLRVQKRDGSTENYSKDKLVKGLKYSLHKRPYEPEGFKKLISEVEKQIQLAAKDDAIEAKKIGEIVMYHLKNFDKVAYVRFASVYQEFKDPNEFAKEVEKLKK